MIEVEHPTLGILEFPEGTSNEQITEAIRQAEGMGSGVSALEAQGIPVAEARPAGADTDFRGRPRSFAQVLPPVNSIGDAWNRVKAAAAITGQRATSFDDERLMNTIMSYYPDAHFEQGPDGETVVDFGAMGGGRGNLRDIGSTIENAGVAAVQFAGPARLASALGGGLARQTAVQGAAAGATEMARDVASQAMGGTDNISASNIDKGNLAITSAFGAAGPAISRAIERVAAPFLRGRAPVLKEDGTLSDEAMTAIQETGGSPVTMDRQVARQMVSEGAMSPEEASRFNLFRSQGMEPTKANITRTADDSRFQQEALKRSGPLREAVDSQDRALAGRFEELGSRTGGTATDRYGAGEEVYSSIVRRSLDEDAAISGLYRQAREAAGTEMNIRPERTVKALREVSSRDTLANGMVRAIRGELQQRGIIDAQWRPQGRMDVNTAEEIRQVMNSFFDGANPQGRQIISRAKQALDDDVFSTVGEDVFREARAARTQFRANLERAKANKFDKQSRSLVEDVLENQINPEQIFDRAVLGQRYGVDDLQMLRRYLNSGTPEQVAQGEQAWNTLRRQTMDYLLEQSTRGAGRLEGGGNAFSGTQLRRAMDRIGNRKLQAMFPGDEMRDLAALREIADLRLPVSMTQQGEGPTSFAVKEVLGNTIPGTRLISKVFGGFREARREALATQPARDTIRSLERSQGIGQEAGQAVSQGARGVTD